MNKLLRNAGAVVAGLLVGSAVNMGLILLGPVLIPPPEGADVTTEAGLRASMHLFELKHFLFPFLAHALGTLAGALLAALLGGSSGIVSAWIVGVAFLVGGIASVFLLPAPLWFSALDLLLAYLPMTWFGLVITQRLSARTH